MKLLISVKRTVASAAFPPTLLARRPLQEVDWQVETILRNNKILIPRSNSKFEKGDTVVFLTKSDQISLVENMFRISSI